MKKRFLLPTLVLALVGAANLAAPGEPAPDGPAAFARLKALAGDWEGHVTSPDGPAAKVEYRLTGNASAVVERLFPGTPHEMTTVYYLDGSNLVLTHYCVVGNQPHMKLIAGGATGELKFDFAGGQNVDEKKGVHMHSLVFKTLTADRYDSSWTMMSDGASGGDKDFFMTRTATAPK
jgi:hypothetical protein